MRLTVKLTVAITAVMLAVMAALGALVFRREDELFVSDMIHDDEVIGVALAIAEDQTWETQEKAGKLLEAVTRHAPHLALRLVSFTSRPGDPQFPAVAIDDTGVFANVDDRRYATAQDARYLYTYVPLSSDPTGAMAIEIRESLDARDVYRRNTLISLGGAALLMFVLATLAAFGVGAWIIGRPVRALVDFSKALGSGNYERRVHLSQKDEIGTLGQSMNSMAAQIAEAKKRLVEESRARAAMAEELRHADRLKTVGTLASGLAHELGTPLNVISGRAKLIMAGAVVGPEVSDSARIIREQAERINGIIRQVLDFARRAPSDKGPTHLGQLIDRTRTLLEPLARKGAATIEKVEPEESILAWANPGQLEQVLTNLIVNAVQAMPNGGRIRVGARSCRARPPFDVGGDVGRFAELWVEDEGVGINSEALPHVFEPFYTTKDVGVGTGLGLSVAYSIVRENDGWFDVRSDPGKGSRFTVFVPLEKRSDPNRPTHRRHRNDAGDPGGT
jgi:two-component system, NtrC family, sensor kinase